MRRFIQKALKKIELLSSEQVRDLLDLLSVENERLENVLNSMTDGILVADEGHNLLLANKAAERLLPMMVGENQERPLWLAIDDEEISDFLKKALRANDRVEDRQFTLDRSGPLRTLSLSIMALVGSGRVRGSLIHVEDVTERKSREARLRRAESLAALSTLSAGVAHEIKNPLASISIHIQLMKKATKACRMNEQGNVGHYLDVLAEEVERLNHIVVDFLFAVRPMNFEPEVADLNAFLSSIMEFMGAELRQSGILPILELEEGLPPMPFDPRLLKQAILNLVKNAIAAMPSGGELTMSTARQGDDVAISVTDTGTGIDEETLQKIFEPYFTTRETGSGLGLTLVFKIAREHGGEIQVTSKPGIGSTFTITIPLPSSGPKLLAQESSP